MAAAAVQPLLPTQHRAGAAQVRAFGMDDSLRVQLGRRFRQHSVRGEASLLEHQPDQRELAHYAVHG